MHVSVHANFSVKSLGFRYNLAGVRTLRFLLAQYLDTIRQFVQENLRNIAHAPSVQMQDVPPDMISTESLDEPNPDVRNPQEEEDKRYEVGLKSGRGYSQGL